MLNWFKTLVQQRSLLNYRTYFSIRICNVLKHCLGAAGGFFWLVLCFFWVYKRWTRLLFSYFSVMTPFFGKIYNLFPFTLFCYLIQWLFFLFQFPPMFSRSCNAYFSATKPFHRISLAVTISFQFLVSYNYTHEVFLGLVTLFQGNCFLFNFKKCFSWQNNSSSIFTFEIVPLKFLSSDLNYFLFIFQELKG